MHYTQIPSNFSNYGHPQVIRTGQVLIANRGLEHINCILPSQINRGALYLGDVISTLKTDLLQKNQIKAVLTCMTEPSNSFLYPVSRLNQNIQTHKILPIRDNLQFPIAQYFIEAKNFIDQARSKGFNVLVHCHAGVSRSAAIVCAYLMHQNVWTVETALEFVRQKRYRAKPNANFISQLNNFWEHQVKHISRNLTQNLPQNHKQNHKMQRIVQPKQQKTIIITLDEEVETHDELYQMYQRKKLMKIKQSNVRRNQTDRNVKVKEKLFDKVEKQLNNEIKQRHIFKTARGRQEQKQSTIRNDNDKFMANKSQIFFNKAFDPKLVKSNVQIKNIDPVNPHKNQEINLIENNSCLFEQNHNSTSYRIKQLPKSMNGSILFNKQCMTPVKQKRDLQSKRIVFSNVYEKGSNMTPNERVSSGVGYEGTPQAVVINYGDKTPKNYSRYSLTGQKSSYKQFY